MLEEEGARLYSVSSEMQELGMSRKSNIVFYNKDTVQEPKCQ
jgi:hypothetical protein